MNDDAQKKLLIHDINRTLERLAKKFGNAFMQEYYNKIESKIGTANIYWKLYPGKTTHDRDGNIHVQEPLRVLAISQAKNTLQTVYMPALRDIRSRIPSVTQMRAEYYDEYIEEQTLSGFEGTIDEFIKFVGNIDERIKSFLQNSNYRNGDGWFWNAMPQNRDGKIISYSRIAQELEKYGY